MILLNYKDRGLLKQCLKGIIAAQPQLEYEVIVVDNNSADGSLALAAEMLRREEKITPPWISVKQLAKPPFRTIQSEKNLGFGGGHNLGIKAAAGRYILIVNPDIALVPGALEKMHSFMEANPDVGMIGPKLIYPDGTIQYSCRRFPTSLIPLYRRTVFGKLRFAEKATGHYLMQDSDHQQAIPVDWLFGACLMIRKSALDKVGLFDERFFMYFEDLDLCRRFWQNGFKVVYLPTVVLVHYHQRLSAEKGGILGIFSSGGRMHVLSGIKYFVKYLGQKPPIFN